ncbi:MAG: STAS/SEC14 domain-containing protein [Gammaproteobacteria bacterium]|nr:STAS/SEC14 domain-containing protein [Gammaproteobacteria bacterium]
MIKHELLTDAGVVVVTPEGRLEADDFKQLAAAVDPYIAVHGKLNGILIHVKSFPGWRDFAGLLSHLSFVKEHHRQIAKVALVTDSKAAAVAESLAKHFVNAKIRHFDFTEKLQALAWMKQDG